MKTLWGDLETYSDTPIKNGTYRYAQDAEIMLFTYALDDDPVSVWDLTAGEPMPDDLAEALLDDSILINFQNSMFDRSVFRLARNTNPILVQAGEAIHRWRDTMVKALAHSLPGALGKTCEIFNLAEDVAKQKDGKALIQLFCKPRPVKTKLRRATAATHPAEWARFLEYAKGDITSMRIVDRKIPDWNYPSQELSHWHLDQKINDRGVLIDLDLAHAAIAAAEEAKARLASECHALTNGEVESATKRDKLLAHLLLEYGIDLPDLQASTLERRINDPDLPPAMRELLVNRQQAAMGSTSKYKAMLKAVNDDGRARGLLQFDGASRTGRWGGRTVQPQNMFRPPKYLSKDWEFSVEAVKAGAAPLFFDNVMEATAGLARAALIPAKGKKFVVADLSNIEGRDQAWLAGEEWKLQAFRDFDTIIGWENGKVVRKGHDLYKLAYAKSFGIAPEDVTDDQRQVGKVQELACLAPSTQVLTSTGVKAIVEVLLTDKVWDGESWVAHQGLVARGVKRVVNVAGMELTPDHLILTKGTWIPAQQLVSNENILCQALETGSENLPYSVLSARCGVRVCRTLLKFSAHAAHRPIKYLITTFVKGNLPAAMPAQRSSQIIGENNTTVTRTLCQMPPIAVDYSTVSPPASIAVETRTTGVTQTTGGGEYVSTLSGKRIAKSFWRISSLLKIGASKISIWIGSTLTATTNLAIYVLYRVGIIATTSARFKHYRSESPNWKPTFDLLNAGSNNRFTVITDRGPMIVHNCGYGGGVGAFLTFSLAYSLDLEDLAQAVLPSADKDMVADASSFYDWTVKQRRSTFGLSREAFIACDVVKRGWRAAHPNISAHWGEIEDAFRSATQNPGKRFTARRLVFLRSGNWLRVILPSGRSLCYPAPQVAEKGELSYMGVNQYTRKWQRVKTYGGKLFENVCQSVACHVMKDAMPGIENEGYEILLTVHDEVICEAPDTDEFNEIILSELLAANPPWAQDMPLAAAGFQGYRYRKG